MNAETKMITDRIEEKIRQLMTLRELLTELDSLFEGTPSLDADNAVLPKPARRKSGRRKTAVAAESRFGVEDIAVHVSAGELELLEVVRGLPEPFAAASVPVITGTKKLVSNRLFKWKRLGWIVAAARGMYTRTADFPAKPE